jgi:VanZ family protein
MSLRSVAIPLFVLTLVLFLGTSFFGADHTSLVLVPLIKAIAPGASPHDVKLAHLLVRKLAHMTEYAALALSWFVTLAGNPARTPRRAAWLALAVCIACAILDETHQSFVPTRTASALDVVIDGVAALLALVAARVYTESGGSGDVAPIAVPVGD